MAAVLLVVMHALLAASPAGVGSQKVGTHAVETDALIWRSQRACGVNALTLLLDCNDITVNYGNLTDQLLHSSALPSLTDLKQAARDAGLSTSLGRTDRGGLTRIEKPVIAHCEVVGTKGQLSGHFVVVLAVDDDFVTIVDGTTVEISTMKWPEFLRKWSGYLLYADKDATNGPLPEVLAALCLGGLFGIAVEWTIARYNGLSAIAS